MQHVVVVMMVPRGRRDLRDHKALLVNQERLEIQDRLMPLHIALFVEPSPGPVKYAASKVAGINDATRLPLAPISDATKAQVDDALRHAGLLN